MSDSGAQGRGYLVALFSVELVDAVVDRIDLFDEAFVHLQESNTRSNFTGKQNKTIIVERT